MASDMEKDDVPLNEQEEDQTDEQQQDEDQNEEESTHEQEEEEVKEAEEEHVEESKDDEQKEESENENKNGSNHSADEDFQGFDKEEVQNSSNSKKRQILSDDDDDDDEEEDDHRQDTEKDNKKKNKKHHHKKEHNRNEKEKKSTKKSREKSKIKSRQILSDSDDDDDEQANDSASEKKKTQSKKKVGKMSDVENEAETNEDVEETEENENENEPEETNEEIEEIEQQNDDEENGHEQSGEQEEQENENEQQDDQEEHELEQEEAEQNEEIEQEQEEQADNDEEEEERPKKARKGSVESPASDDDNEDEGSTHKRKKEMTDLEMVLSKQKEENRKKNRRKKIDSEELNEMDNVISSIITEMKTVANDDRVANSKGLTAVHKLKMLSNVVNLLQKSDYHATMIELGILGAIAEWLAPLPDRSLPNIKIRETLIDSLKDFGEINADYLKSSGIGKAVMFLYKHSKETKQNKQKLEKLIHDWSRPIFNLDGNFKQLSKEERMNRDLEHVKTLNRRSSMEGNQNQSVDDLLNPGDRKSYKKLKPNEDSDRSGSDEPNKILRPGDPGFCPRARVPMPSVKDYVYRPKSNVELNEMSDKKVKKTVSRLDKHKRRFTEIKRVSKFQQAVKLNVSGKF